MTAAIPTDCSRLKITNRPPLSLFILLPALALLMTAAIVGCGSSNSGSDKAPSLSANSQASVDQEEKVPETPGLHNLLKVSERIYSGSEPHGDDGFASLERLGIKTIVSVDGAKPQLDLAHKHGIRYVHIPIGYDRIPQEAGASLTRVVREIQGPIYIHCHHGKHRGPAAVAVACIASGEITAKEAMSILERAGTSKDYAGLWRDVERFTPPSKDAELPNLVEDAEVDSLAAAMAGIDRNFDNLKLCRDANWSVPSDHPDLVAVQEALLVKEGLAEAVRHTGDKFDDRFKKWLIDAESAADDLLAALHEENIEKAGQAFPLLEKSCKQCHKAYRDR